jgi:putative acetyltransferase
MTNKNEIPNNPNESKKFYEIELFNLKDQEAISKFGLKVSEEAGQTYDPTLDSDWDHIKEVYIDPGGIFYVVKNSEQIIGCAGVKNIDNDNAEFKRARILKEFEGRGICRNLLEKSLAFAKSEGFLKIKLDTNNPAIVHLCEEFGFKKFDEKGNVSFWEKDL